MNAFSETGFGRYSLKQVLLKISRYSELKEAQTMVLFCELVNFLTTAFYRTTPVAASVFFKVIKVILKWCLKICSCYDVQMFSSQNV